MVPTHLKLRYSFASFNFFILSLVRLSVIDIFLPFKTVLLTKTFSIHYCGYRIPIVIVVFKTSYCLHPINLFYLHINIYVSFQSFDNTRYIFTNTKNQKQFLFGYCSCLSSFKLTKSRSQNCPQNDLMT